MAMVRALVALSLLSCSRVLADCSPEGDCAAQEGDVESLVQLRAGQSQLAGYAPCPECLSERKSITIGTMKTSFHNVTMWVYVKAMQELGISMNTVTDYGHAQVYAMFTGGKGIAAGCKDEGCTELCEAQGLGKTSPCVDLIVDSNIDYYHAPFVVDYKDDFYVIGTAFEAWYQGLWVPPYSNVTTLSEAAADPRMQTDIIGFKSNDGDDCDSMYCPGCPGAVPLESFKWLSGPPLAPCFKYIAESCKDFTATLEQKLEEKVHFLIYSWNLAPWHAAFGLKPLNLEQYQTAIWPVAGNLGGNSSKPVTGKVLLRKGSRDKFNPEALAVLGSVFVGSDGVKEMTAWAAGWTPDGKKLCPSQGWNSACASEAADLWINNNQDRDADGTALAGAWPKFFW